jgi:hypothetical protein
MIPPSSYVDAYMEKQSAKNAKAVIKWWEHLPPISRGVRKPRPSRYTMPERYVKKAFKQCFLPVPPELERLSHEEIAACIRTMSMQDETLGQAIERTRLELDAVVMEDYKRRGIVPRVIAKQKEVRTAFYLALIDGKPVEEASVEALTDLRPARNQS